MEQEVHDPLVVALDFDNRESAEQLVQKLGDAATIYKVGLELIFSSGLEFAKELIDQNKRIFLDMKFLDIGNTVERAVSSVSDLGFDFLTIHGHDRKTLEAAVAGRKNPELNLLAVTVLTSLDIDDLREQGISAEGPHDLAVRRAKMAYECGFQGVIASGREARAIREATSEDFIIKTPGIRLTGDATGDQVRVMTPDLALKEGANYLVVGRPITQAPDSLAATKLFRKAINKAQSEIAAAS